MILALKVLLALGLTAMVLRVVVGFVWIFVLRGDLHEVQRRLHPLMVCMRLFLLASVALYALTALLYGGESVWPPWNTVSSHAPFLAVLLLAVWLFGRFIGRYSTRPVREE